MKYATIDNNGLMTGAFNDETLEALPADGISMTEAEWANRWNVMWDGSKWTQLPPPEAGEEE